MEANNDVFHEKVLITVKTYPTISSTYGELVCTAGLRENGSWIRLYPIPFRLLNDESKFKKYQWIELDVVKRSSNKDPRKESFSPAHIDDMRLGEWLAPSDYRRKEIVYRSRIFTSMDELTSGEKKDRVSLATFRPTTVKRMIAERCERDWNETQRENADRAIKQAMLYDPDDVAEMRKTFNFAQKIPYRFKYVFDDEDGKEHRLMVEDWEIGVLYLNLLKSHDEKTAVEMTVAKYQDLVDSPDFLFFLGSTRDRHHMAPNPFIIIGVYYQSPKMKEPPDVEQTSFLDC